MKPHIDHDLLPILTEIVDGTSIDLPLLTEAIEDRLTAATAAFPLTDDQCRQLAEQLFPRLETALRDAIGSRSAVRWERSMQQVRAALPDLLRDTLLQPR